MVLVIVAAASPAAAHDAARSSFEARAALTAAGEGVQITFRLDATSLADLTSSTDGVVVLAYLDQRFSVSRGGLACSRETPRTLAPEAGGSLVVVDVVYQCTGDGAVRLESTLFHDEAIPHQVIGTIRTGSGRVDRYFFTRGERVVTVDLASAAVGGFRSATPPPGAFSGAPRPSVAEAAPTSPEAREARPMGTGLRAFYREGILHILGGLDHLLFVLLLMLAVDSWRRLAVVITAFTAAHSLTLFLGATGLVAVSPRLIEPLIAASIVAVALDNVVRRAPNARFGLVFAFGLIHGLGFSGALAGLGFAPRELALPLLGFNLGVETGQLLVVAPLFPVLLWLRRHPRLFRRAQVVLCGLIAVVATIWLFERLTTT